MLNAIVVSFCVIELCFNKPCLIVVLKGAGRMDYKRLKVAVLGAGLFLSAAVVGSASAAEHMTPSEANFANINERTFSLQGVPNMMAETPERGAMERTIKAYELPVNHVDVNLTYPRSSQYKEVTLKILFPMNNPKDYGKMPHYDGFPKEIPSFAKDAQIYYVPQFLKAGAVGQVSFSGTKEEMAPYFAEAKRLAIDTMTIKDSRNVYVQLESDSNMDYALSARQLLLDYDIRRTDTLKNLGTVPEFVPGLMNDSKAMAAQAAGKPMLLSDRENKKLQRQLLGYYSYEFNSVQIPDDYTLYVFNVGGVPDHQVMTGVLVSPDQTKMIYFYNQR